MYFTLFSWMTTWRIMNLLLNYVHSVSELSDSINHIVSPNRSRINYTHVPLIKTFENVSIEFLQYERLSSNAQVIIITLSPCTEKNILFQILNHHWYIRMKEFTLQLYVSASISVNRIIYRRSKLISEYRSIWIKDEINETFLHRCSRISMMKNDILLNKVITTRNDRSPSR